MKLSIKFHPFLWLTIFTIVTFFILVLLGTWQVKRLFWKNNLTTNYNEKFNKQKIVYNRNLEYNQDLEYRRILIKGKFLNEKEILIIGKTYEGNAGFHLITPLLTNDNKIVLINRGWISEKLKLQKSRLSMIFENEVIVDGIIRKPQLKGYFVPDNDPSGGFWFTIKPNEIKNFLALVQHDFEQRFYIDSIQKKNNKTLPIGVTGSPNFRNQHLSYAITWYSLAITLIAIYLAFHIKEKRLIIKRNRT